MKNLIELYGVSSGAIRAKAHKLKVRKRVLKPWSPEEERTLLAFGSPITYKIASFFNRSPNAVRTKLRELTRGRKKPESAAAKSVPAS